MTQESSKTRFNAHVLSVHRLNELRAELANIGAEWPGVVKMARKAQNYVVKVHNLRNPLILILKEEMLAKGGDCAIHRDAITAKIERSDCVLIGSEKIFHQVLGELRAQPFGLPKLAAEIRAAIDNYKRTFPLTPADEDLPENLRPMYSAMKERTLVMGVLNVTPDSFSDGGIYADFNAAVQHGVQMAEEGADLIDIGGESSRPGSDPVSPQEEMDRVLPVIKALSERVQIPISIDTYRPEVVRDALDAGASIINDISGLSDPDMRALAAERKCPSIIMHMKGTPKTMQENPEYADVVDEIIGFFRERVNEVVEAGLPESHLIIDPGIGFGKSFTHNIEILRKLADFKSIGLPILIGASRKAFIGHYLGGLPPAERTFGTAATTALAIQNGANIIRVHDVKEMTQVARMTDVIVRQGEDVEPERHTY